MSLAFSLGRCGIGRRNAKQLVNASRAFSTMPPKAKKMSTMPAMEEEAVQKIGGAHSWTGQDLVNSKWWGYTLPDSALAELDDAVKYARDANLEWEGDIPLNISQEKFPLKQMGDIIAEMSDELENGQGAAMIANIPVDKYSLEEVR